MIAYRHLLDNRHLLKYAIVLVACCAEVCMNETEKELQML